MQGQIAVRKHGKVDVVPGGVSGGADEIRFMEIAAAV
jgi:hypothetical protein